MVSGAPNPLVTRRRLKPLVGGFVRAHKALFQTSRDPVIVIVGDVSGARVKSLLAKTFGALTPVEDVASQVRYIENPVAGVAANRKSVVGVLPGGEFKDNVDVELFHHCINHQAAYDNLLKAILFWLKSYLSGWLIDCVKSWV